jgi:hypothetical protein
VEAAPRPHRPWRRSVPRLLAGTVIVAAFLASRLPATPAAERQALASRFAFQPIPLDPWPGSPARTLRDVHPALTRIQSWVSSLGAGAAFADLDGDGLPNDLCVVDPRFDRVVVQPAPGTGARYALFALDQPDRRHFVVPTGCVPGDLDEDGRTDLLVLHWGRPPIAYLRLPSPTPLEASGFAAVEIGSSGDVWNSNTGTFADLDGDGHLDIVVGNYFPDGVRVLDPQASGDAPMQYSMSRAYNGGSTRLLRWESAAGGERPTVRFRDVSASLPADARAGWTHAVGAADLDGDGLPELYVTNDFAPDRLFHNRSTPGRIALHEVHGRRGWTTPRSKVLGRDSFKGMGVDFGDVNGDLVPDIYVSNIAVAGIAVESHFLFVSDGPITLLAQGVAPYADRSEPLGVSRSGWGWDSKLADFDDDGVLEAVQATGFIRGDVDRWPELHELTMVNDELLPSTAVWPRFRSGDDISGREHTRFFARRGGEPFEDIALELGLEPKGDPYVTRGIAMADVDGDGDLDFLMANQWQPFVFYRNDSPARGASLNLRLLRRAADGGRGAGALVPAVGATLTVTDPGGRRHVSFVDGGNGHTGRRSADVHVGLGAVAADAPLDVRVVWRDGRGRHEQAASLTPGRHTVVLGGGGAR